MECPTHYKVIMWNLRCEGVLQAILHYPLRCSQATMKTTKKPHRPEKHVFYIKKGSKHIRHCKVKLNMFMPKPLAKSSTWVSFVRKYRVPHSLQTHCVKLAIWRGAASHPTLPLTMLPRDYENHRENPTIQNPPFLIKKHQTHQALHGEIEHFHVIASCKDLCLKRFFFSKI